VTEVYLVRHAHADWTPDESRPLSDRGLVEAQRVADGLGRLTLSAIHSSPYGRARQTVEPLAARLSLPINEHPDLRERTLMEGRTTDFLEASRVTWADFRFAHPGGESNLAAQRRGVAVCEQLVARYPDGRVVISTHGTLLALILNRYDERIGFDFWARITTPDVYRLAIDASDRATIERVGL
jgi:2,3-bisphosphoglycerate-dependent phosphoglycerate mutase